jgi:hypothetical protein
LWVAVNWHALTFVEVGSDTIGLEALNVAVVSAVSSLAVPDGTGWALMTAIITAAFWVAVHWHALTVVEVGSHAIGLVALNVAVVDALVTGAVPDGTGWAPRLIRITDHKVTHTHIVVGNFILATIQVANGFHDTITEFNVEESTVWAVSLSHRANVSSAVA